MTIPYKERRLPIERVFRDPVHDYIHVQHQVILGLIDSAEMQRLRRIKRLGTSSFTFHGAEHNRFSHSLDVYEVTCRIYEIFQRNYSVERLGENGWNDDGRLVTLYAALLHDIGRDPYSCTFEHIFDTNHEAITVQIIISPGTRVYQILNRVSADFPEKVASVITKQYLNPQVVQMISGQTDTDHMDYLLCDAYFIEAEYGTFDLTGVLRVIQPCKGGIAFAINGMHAVEDYIVSRYWMYVQVCFHPVSRRIEMILDHLLHRTKELFRNPEFDYDLQASLPIPFFKKDFTLQEYLKLDDGVLSTYFTQWMDVPDLVLGDLAKRFLMRKPLESATFTNEEEGAATITYLRELIEKVGFNLKYYAAINSSYDLPYGFYRPDKDRHCTQIESIQKGGSLVELTTVSPLVIAFADQNQGDERFYFPKEMLSRGNKKHYDLFDETYRESSGYTHNNALALRK